MKVKYAIILLLLISLMSAIPAYGSGPDYSDPYFWISSGENNLNGDYDVFMILPTVDPEDTSIRNEDIYDPETVYMFHIVFDMEKGIVGDNARIYCPLYRQKTLGCYVDDYEREAIAAETGEESVIITQHEYIIAYEDIKAAFEYYIQYENQGRPYILFGYSQGAEMILQLLKDMGNDEMITKNLVAAYMIGWRVTEKDLEECPHLKMAQGEDDTGVIICFECFDERAEMPYYSSYSINPLNWKTDDTPASRKENIAYVETDYDGSVILEIPHFCGAYIDPETGMLLITDMDDSLNLYEQYDEIYWQGYYHLHDLNLFYRNVQQNIENRVISFIISSNNY